MSRNLNSIIKRFKILLEIDKSFSLNYALCFLLISQSEGINITELSVKAELNISTISRIVSALGNKRQKVAEGLDLIEVRTNSSNKREKKLYLTSKGKKLINELSLN